MTYLRGILLSTVFSVASPFFLSEKANAVPPNQGDEAPVLSRAAPVPSGRRDNAMNDAAVLLASMGSPNDRSEASSQDKESLQESRPAPVLAQALQDYEESLGIKDAQGQPVLRGVDRARALRERGHDSQALQDYEEALGMKDAQGQPVLRGMARAQALSIRVTAHWRLGHHSQAIQDLEEELGMKDAQGRDLLMGNVRIYAQRHLATLKKSYKIVMNTSESSSASASGMAKTQTQQNYHQSAYGRVQQQQQQSRTQASVDPHKGVSASAAASDSKELDGTQQQLIDNFQFLIQSQQRTIDQQSSEIDHLRKRLAEAESETQRPEKRSRND